MNPVGDNNGDRDAAGESSNLLTLLPLWFVAVATLIYGTGFLAVLTFHESYNLRGLEAGFFKIKYAHVGVMFTAIPLIIGLAVFALFQYAKRAQEAQASGTRLEPFKGPPHPLVILLVTLIAMTFYLFALFGPPGTFGDVHWNLGIMLVVAAVGRIIAELVVTVERQRFLLPARLIVITFLAVLLLRVTWGFKEHLMEMFIPGGLWYLVLSLFMGWIVWLLVEGAGSLSSGRDALVWRGVKVMILALAYYLAVLSFGLGVYHYIPAGKGGGDFTTSSLVILKLKPNEKSKLPKWLSEDNPNADLKLELIESSDASVFVANPWKKALGKNRAESGPATWRRGRKHRPNVLEISRDQIVSIQHLHESYASWIESHGNESADK